MANFIFTIKRKIVYSVPGYTRQTPTPAPGLVSLDEFEYLEDIHLRTVDRSTAVLLTRMEGKISESHWQSDEKAIFLKFEIWMVPWHGFLFELDLETGMYEKILPMLQDQSYGSSFSISPDENLIVYSLNSRSPNPGIYLRNIQSGEERVIRNYPTTNIVTWLDEGNWLMFKGRDFETTFYFYDIKSEVVWDEFNIKMGSSIPYMLLQEYISPSGEKIAFNGYPVDSDEAGLYVMEICPSKN